MALGVQSNVTGRVRSGKTSLDYPGFFVRHLKLAKAEGENAGAAEFASRFRRGDRSDERGPLGNGDSVVGIEDRFSDGGLDRLAVFGCLRADRLIEIRLDNPTSGIDTRRVGGRKGLFPEVTLLRGPDSQRWKRGLCGNLDGVRSFNGSGRALLDALGMVRNLAVNELNEAVTLLGANEDRDIAAGDGKKTIELTAKEASLDWRRGDRAKDWGAVDGIARLEGDGGAVGED